MGDWIGWLATAAFASSYFFKDARAMRRVQALAAGLWIAYGLLVRAYPVVVANVVIAVLAIGSAWRRPRSEGRNLADPEPREPIETAAPEVRRGVYPRILANLHESQKKS